MTERRRTLVLTAQEPVRESDSHKVAESLHRMRVEGESFFHVVLAPLEVHDLTRSDVTWILWRAMETSGGDFWSGLKYLGVPEVDVEGILWALRSYCVVETIDTASLQADESN